MRARPACPTLSGNHRQRAADCAGLEHPASPRPYGTRARCRPGRREHWQTGTRSDRTSVPGGGGILAARTAADMPSWACTVVRNHARMHLGARWSAACQGAVPPAGNMRGAPSRAASSEGAGARCGGDAATATRSLDIATESGRRRAAAEEGSGARGVSRRGALAWAGRARHNNQPTNRRARGAYGGGGGFR